MPKSEYKKIRFNNARHNLRILGLAGLMAASSIKDANAAEPKSRDRIEAVTQKKSKPAATTQTPSLTKTYKINNRQDFDKLWNDAKPFCIPVLIASENWRQDWHNDKQKTAAAPNSVGVGMFKFPSNRDFTYRGKWGSTRGYYNTYKQKHHKAPKPLTPQEIQASIYGWGDAQSNGANLTSLYNTLRGTELTINEFAAIYSRYFHTGNLNLARKIVSIKKNPKIKDKKLACAKAFLDTDPILEKQFPGRKSRFMHEMLVFLNTDNYCNDIFYLCVDCHLGTSINACPSQYWNVYNGKLTYAKAQAIKTKICNYTVPNGIQIKKLCEKIGDKKIMAFCVTTKQSKQMAERDELYQKAMNAYNKKDYKTAKKYFVQVIAKNGEGPDLWNDIAITYYNLGEYDKCIEICREKILKDSDAKIEYTKACFNAGKAYEAQGNYQKALDNYEAALKYYQKYGVADKDPNIDYAGTYQVAINRVKQQLTPAKQTTVKKRASTQTKATPKKVSHKKVTPKKAQPQKKSKAKKSAVAFLVGMTAIQKKGRQDSLKKFIKKARTK